ncbi:alpha/beta fold hydrolase [Streptomyces sp. NPDC049577]|uniref:thioesterase II family protein n=1 Tax=Streptomyces sp. NPDC049577 TaxID=3155153 RepID=UPI00342726B7
MQPDDDKWVITLKRASERPGIKLICFPYAGGSPEMFRAWADGLSDRVELLAVRLPGRGRRLKETLPREWEPLLAEIFEALSPRLSDPHAFYGHSFGARLAYEVARLAVAGCPGATRRLFVSGSRSPGSPQRRPYLHELSDAAFADAVREMGGTPAEILDNPVMARFFLPIVRADIRLAEIWDDRHGSGVDLPITALYGGSDPIDGADSMSGWRTYGNAESELVETAGGHFFPDTHRAPLLDIINSRLQRDA